MVITGDEAFKSICRVLGPLTKKPTLGVQHAVEAGYLFKEHASISAWFFNFLSYCEVTKPLTRIKTITRMRRIYKRRLVIPGFIISGCEASRCGQKYLHIMIGRVLVPEADGRWPSRNDHKVSSN